MYISSGVFCLWLSLASTKPILLSAEPLRKINTELQRAHNALALTVCSFHSTHPRNLLQLLTEHHIHSKPAVIHFDVLRSDGSLTLHISLRIRLPRC